MVYFGTDGIRGVYGEGITEDIAYRAGFALAMLFGGKAIVGRDTRLSGPQLEDALSRGIIDGGADALIVGVLPTPAVSYLTKESNATFGVMLSASHNPPEYNGIKVFAGNGEKLSSSAEEAVEYYMDYPEKSKSSGSLSYESSDRYFDYISSLATDLHGMKIMLDHGCGSGGEIAKRVFERAGATVRMMCDGGGDCINCRCGALYPEKMQRDAARGGFDLGFSFDGDADRVVCYAGRLLHGDEVLFNLARIVDLGGGTVVGTVLTNSALSIALQTENKRLIRTSVGDKNISEIMRSFGYLLGGEQSGHYIISPYEVTGDGLLSALFIAKKLKSGIARLDLFPQKAVSLFAPPSIMSEKRLTAAVAAVQKKVRTVVRMSGTEPKIRIMTESENEQDAVRAIDMLTAIVKDITK